MEIKELQEFIDWEMKRLEKRIDMNNDELKPWSAIKLSEEVGELQAEVLGHAKIQRKEKLDKFTEMTFADEIADVIITTFILGRRHGINVEKAIKEKIEKIKERPY